MQLDHMVQILIMESHFWVFETKCTPIHRFTEASFFSDGVHEENSQGRCASMHIKKQPQLGFNQQAVFGTN